MWRLYLIGIIYWIMILNIPEVRDFSMNKVQIYRPKVQSTLVGWGDTYTPALESIIADLLNSGQTIINGKVVDTALNKTPVDTTNSWSMTHKNSITADQFDNILRDYGSPAAGLGANVTTYAASKRIDNAYVLYMYIHESTAGTKGIAVKTKSTGNIKCHLNNNCIEGFQAYYTIEDGFRDHIDLLAFYRDELGDQDIYAALSRWAPATENNQDKDCNKQQSEGKALSYPCGLMINVTKWRQANNNVAALQNQIENFSRKDIPQVNPVLKANQPKPHYEGRIIQISYGMTITAAFDTVDCNYWGFQLGCQHWGTDILVCVDCPVFTPVDCTYLTTGEYNDPSHIGDYFMCTTYDGYEYYSGHLARGLKLTPGDFVPAGTVVGYGCACVSGPHTHIQLRDPNGNLVDFMKYYQERI